MCDHSKHYWNASLVECKSSRGVVNYFNNGKFRIICSGCNRDINDDIITLVKSNKLISTDRLWKNSKNIFIKFEDIDYIYLKNISNKIKKSLIDPNSAASKKFLTQNTGDIIRKMINYLGEKGLIKK